jgi:hypothetical protein
MPPCPCGAWQRPRADAQKIDEKALKKKKIARKRNWQWGGNWRTKGLVQKFRRSSVSEMEHVVSVMEMVSITESACIPRCYYN